jgi:hypothetical protein
MAVVDKAQLKAKQSVVVLVVLVVQQEKLLI